MGRSRLRRGVSGAGDRLRPCGRPALTRSSDREHGQEGRLPARGRAVTGAPALVYCVRIEDFQPSDRTRRRGHGSCAGSHGEVARIGVSVAEKWWTRTVSQGPRGRAGIDRSRQILEHRGVTGPKTRAQILVVRHRAPSPGQTSQPTESRVGHTRVRLRIRQRQPVCSPSHPVGPHVVPPPPRILAVANQKGGVGKTTTAINLGTALAAIGERVLIVDLDPQGNASTGLGIDRRSRRFSTYDVLIGELRCAIRSWRRRCRACTSRPRPWTCPGWSSKSAARDRAFRLRNALRPLNQPRGGDVATPTCWSIARPRSIC